MMRGWNLTLFCVQPFMYSLGKPQCGHKSIGFDARQTWT